MAYVGPAGRQIYTIDDPVPVNRVDDWAAQTASIINADTSILERVQKESERVTVVEGVTGRALVRQPDLGSTDLDTVRLQGVYPQGDSAEATVSRHYPELSRGTLLVQRVNEFARTQTYLSAVSGKSYSRQWDGSTWGAWYDPEARMNGRILAADADFHAITEDATHKMQNYPINWVAQNMPVDVRGSLRVTTFGNGRFLFYETYETVPRYFRQSFVGNAWGPWEDVDKTAKDQRDGKALVTNVDLLTLGAGRYRVNFFPKDGDNAPVLGLRGFLDVKPMNDNASAKILEFVSYEGNARLFVNSRIGSSWGGWKEVGGQVEPDKAPEQTPPGSGLKVVPLNVTIGGSSSTDGPLSGTARYPMKWHAPILRVRVCIQNIAPITGTVRTGSVDVNGIWLGKHAGGGAFTGTPKQVVGAFSTPADGSAYKSKWVWLDQTPGVEDLLSLGYTASNGTVGGTIANSWRSADPSVAGTATPPMTASATAPFFVWLEAETYATTPHVAAFGDSLSSGVSAGGPMGSWLARYCERVKALPTHYSNSGDTMKSWASDFGTFKWSVFDGLAKPDALIWAMGSNDLFAESITLAQVQASFSALYPMVSARISPNIYLANIMPRTTVTGEQESKRRNYNEWLAGLPLGARDLFNFRDAISSDDETIAAQFDADGVHLNSAGYASLAAAITRPVTTPPVAYQQL